MGGVRICLAIVAVILYGGCSGSSSTTGAGNDAVQQAAPLHEGGPTPEMINAENPTLLAEGEEIPREVLDRKKSRIEALREKQGSDGAGTVPAGSVKPLSRPAPDNSVYITSLTDVAREIRQFNDHPVLDRVERISDAKSSRTTVYLRTGRTANIPSGRVKNLAIASASELLVAAGLPPMPTPTPAPNIQMPNEEKDAIRRKKAEEQPLVPGRRPQE